jgi:hypothetical protein
MRLGRVAPPDPANFVDADEIRAAGNALREKYAYTKDPKDLVQAIVAAERVLEKHSGSKDDLAIDRNTVAARLIDLFELTHEEQDLSRAITLLEQLLESESFNLYEHGSGTTLPVFFQICAMRKD